MTEALLLDTCAVIWIANGDAFAPEAIAAVQQASEDGQLAVSPITAWEIGVLMARGRMRAPVGPQALMNRFMAETGASYCELSSKILIESSYLPGTPPKDPADRILISTARELGLTVLTRDQEILASSDAGHVLAMRC